MSIRTERCALMLTVALLLSLPAAASDWENILGLDGAAASVTGTGTIGDFEEDIDVDFDDILDQVEMGDHVRMVVQDRAYTSPIRYIPGESKMNRKS